MPYSIGYHPQAEAVLSSLDSKERSRVLARICRLADRGLSDPHVARLEASTDTDPAYVLRAGNNLRVVFSANRESITVLDVLNKHFAERYG